jgi:hypothetical protein
MSAARIHCFTSISYLYLDRARVMAETVRRHHPDWTLWLLLSDEEPPGFTVDPRSPNFDHVVRITQLIEPYGRSWIFEHDVVELCTAVKGPMLHRLLPDGDAVIYLDPDVALFAPLTEVVTLLDRHSIILTPHVLSPEPDYETVPHNEIGSLRHGTYNLGFIAVRNRAEGQRFAAWWRDRLLRFCHDDVMRGPFVDQKWCDLVPALFEDVHILRDPGYNVASWNIATRPLEFTADGAILADGQPLRFFHFTKLNSIGEAALGRFTGGRPEVFELVRWYRERLAANAPDGLPDGWWAYGMYADGSAIPRSHRLAWRADSGLAARFADPFASGPGTFQEWCANAGLR